MEQTRVEELKKSKAEFIEKAKKLGAEEAARFCETASYEDLVFIYSLEQDDEGSYPIPASVTTLDFGEFPESVWTHIEQAFVDHCRRYLEEFEDTAEQN